jgi:hypothetical protein
MFSSYAISALVLYLFLKYRNNLQHPLQVLKSFFYFYSSFPWDSFVLTSEGPKAITSGSGGAATPSSCSKEFFEKEYSCENIFSSKIQQPLMEQQERFYQTVRQHLPSTTANPSKKQSPVDPSDLSITVSRDRHPSSPSTSVDSGQSSSVASISGSHVSSSSCYSSRFPLRACNIQDPLDPSNNLGLSITRNNLLLITKSLTIGLQILENSLCSFQHTNRLANLPTSAPSSSQSCFISDIPPASPLSVNHLIDNGQHLPNHFQCGFFPVLPMQRSKSPSVDFKTRNGVSPFSSASENRSVSNASAADSSDDICLISSGRKEHRAREASHSVNSCGTQRPNDVISSGTPSPSSSLLKTHQWTQFPLLCQVFPLTLSKYVLSGNIRSDLLDRPLCGVLRGSLGPSTNMSSVSAQHPALSPSTHIVSPVDYLTGNVFHIDDMFNLKLKPEETSLHQETVPLNQNCKVMGGCQKQGGDPLFTDDGLVSSFSERKKSAPAPVIPTNRENRREPKRKRRNSVVKLVSSKERTVSTESNENTDDSKNLLIETKFNPSLSSSSSCSDLLLDITSSTTKSSCSVSSSFSPPFPGLNSGVICDEDQEIGDNETNVIWNCLVVLREQVDETLLCCEECLHTITLFHNLPSFLVLSVFIIISFFSLILIMYSGIYFTRLPFSSPSSSSSPLTSSFVSFFEPSDRSSNSGHTSRRLDELVLETAIQNLIKLTSPSSSYASLHSREPHESTEALSVLPSSYVSVDKPSSLPYSSSTTSEVSPYYSSTFFHSITFWVQMADKLTFGDFSHYEKLQASSISSSFSMKYFWLKDRKPLRSTSSSRTGAFIFMHPFYTIESMNVDDIGHYECYQLVNKSAKTNLVNSELTQVKRKDMVKEGYVEGEESIPRSEEERENALKGGKIAFVTEAIIRISRKSLDFLLPLLVFLFFFLALEKPRIRNRPFFHEVRVGGVLTLNLDVEGVPPPSYKWFRNGYHLVDQIHPTLLIENAEKDDSGTYSCQVSNIAGDFTWLEATVVILD